MATANPYTGQQGMEWYEYAWGLGYAYGQQNPAQDQPTPPSVFPPLDVTDDYLAYMQQVWSEGELAGRTDGALHPPAPATPGGENAVALAGHAYEGGMAAYDLGSGIVKLVAGGTEAVGSIGAGVVGFLVMAIGMEEPGPGELAQMAQDQLHAWFARQCSAHNCSDFYLAAYWPDTTVAPPWYGTVHDTFDAARDDAAQHLSQNPGQNLQVAHYKADSPDMIELISLVQDGSQ